MRKKLREGTWFAVPLRTGGFVPGVIARVSPRGGVKIGYFFASLSDKPPLLEAVKVLGPQQAARVLRFGDLGLIGGTWPVLGWDPEWRREKWPSPPFVRKDEIFQVAFLVRYSDVNAGEVVSETRVPFQT